MHRAVILLSGGQDSATCAAWARERFDEVHAISFDYGQRHRTELDAAKLVAEHFGMASHVVVRVPFDDEALRVSSALTDPNVELAASGGIVDREMPQGLPTSFVPGRNMVFLALAAARAVVVGARDLVTGICQTDYSGYPDCRDSFRLAMLAAITEAMPSGAGPFELHAPLMHSSKAETVQLMQALGELDALALTITCYHGTRCGTCPACVLRARGFAEAGVPDPALSR